jgi:hypothetical protein
MEMYKSHQIDTQEAPNELAGISSKGEGLLILAQVITALVTGISTRVLSLLRAV